MVTLVAHADGGSHEGGATAAVSLARRIPRQGITSVNRRGGWGGVSSQRPYRPIQYNSRHQSSEANSRHQSAEARKQSLLTQRLMSV